MNTGVNWKTARRSINTNMDNKRGINKNYSLKVYIRQLEVRGAGSANYERRGGSAKAFFRSPPFTVTRRLQSRFFYDRIFCFTPDGNLLWTDQHGAIGRKQGLVIFRSSKVIYISPWVVRRGEGGPTKLSREEGELF